MIDAKPLENIRRRINSKQSSKGVWQLDITIEIENGQEKIIYDDKQEFEITDTKTPNQVLVDELRNLIKETQEGLEKDGHSLSRSNEE